MTCHLSIKISGQGSRVAARALRTQRRSSTSWFVGSHLWESSRRGCICRDDSLPRNLRLSGGLPPISSTGVVVAASHAAYPRLGCQYDCVMLCQWSTYVVFILVRADRGQVLSCGCLRKTWFSFTGTIGLSLVILYLLRRGRYRHYDWKCSIIGPAQRRSRTLTNWPLQSIKLLMSSRPQTLSRGKSNNENSKK